MFIFNIRQRKLLNYNFQVDSRCNNSYIWLILHGAWAYFMLNVPAYLICWPHIYIVTQAHSFNFYSLHDFGFIFSPLWSNVPLAVSAHKSIYFFIFHSYFFPTPSCSLFFSAPLFLLSPPLSPLSIKVELYRRQQCKRRWEWVLKTVSLCLGFIVSLEGCRITTCHQHNGRPIHFTQGHISQGYSDSVLYVCV